jgi:hypothetical protein
VHMIQCLSLYIRILIERRGKRRAVWRSKRHGGWYADAEVAEVSRGYVNTVAGSLHEPAVLEHGAMCGCAN